MKRGRRRGKEREKCSQNSLSGASPEGDGGVESENPLSEVPRSRGERSHLHLVQEVLGQRTPHVQLTPILAQRHSECSRG